MRFLIVVLFSLTAALQVLEGQTDTERPEAPQLRYVSVDPLNSNTIIRWAPGLSEDVAGYIVYSYVDNEGFSLDTIHNPMATEFRLTGTGPSYFSETFVVAAFDYAGNVSPLSNSISTIHLTVAADSCNNELELTWNGYTSEPVGIINYAAWFSTDGGPLQSAGETSADEHTLTLHNYVTDAEYCFTINAVLEEGPASSSNRYCIRTSMQHPPDWINADYATVNDEGLIELSFTVDPLSEIENYSLERDNGDGSGFISVASLQSRDGRITFTDYESETDRVNIYRITAINNCGLPATYSNQASNIVLDAVNNSGNITLRWNRYRSWMGEIVSTGIYFDSGSGFSFLKDVAPADTSVVIEYNQIMNLVTGNEICFYVEVNESSNPHGINGTARSNRVCLQAIENISVPNLFTPDGDLKNELFRPFLSFIPTSYSLVISDRRGRTLFETKDYTESWDGTFNGSRLPRDVFLWMLKVTTPSGRTISRTGTVTIFRNSD